MSVITAAMRGSSEENIIDGLTSWTEKILDVEEKLKKTKDVRQSVLNFLNRQVLDGFISQRDSIELDLSIQIMFM